jgi:transposase-like protein
MKRISDETILNDIRRVNQSHPNVGAQDYVRLGRHSLITIRKHFGSWNKAKAAAGISIERFAPIPADWTFTLSDEECGDAWRRIRWPEGVKCIRCGLDAGVIILKGARRRPGIILYKCRDCMYQFSDLAGTILQNSNQPLSKSAEFCLLRSYPTEFVMRQVGLSKACGRLKRIMAESRMADDWAAALRTAMEEKI